MRLHATRIAPFVVWIAACSETADPPTPPASGGAAGAGNGGSAGAGAAGTGGTSGSGGATGGTAGSVSGSAGVGGAITAGQGGATAGAGAGGGSGKGGAAGMSGAAGSGGAGAMGGGGASAGAGAGGMPQGGMGGMAGSTAGSAGSGNTTGCTRELLDATTDAYFTALAANDPSTLPLAATAKFTENGEVMDIGQGGLWATAGALVYKHTAIDTDECQVMSQAVVPDGSMDIPVALRLKLVAGEITEAEMIAVRPGDYSLGASNTAALAASDTSVGWEDPVPTADRNTREEIIGWMDKYFRMFPSGVCDVTSACRRIENGGGNFMCLAGASCAAGDPGPGDNELTPRLILADVETGIGIGFTMFQGNTDMHMFKMHGGEVHWVSAVLGAAGNSGW